MNSGQFEKAKRDFKIVIKDGEKKPEFYSVMGHLLNELKKYEKAIKWFNKALEMDNTFAEAYNNRGVSYLRSGQPRRAFEDFNKAIQFDSTYALAYNNRGTARYYNQNVAKPHDKDVLLAIKDFNRAIGIDSSLILAIRNKGIAYRIYGDYESSIENLDLAIAMDAGNPENYLEKARTRAKSEKYEGAINEYLLVLQLDPNSANAYIEMGNAKSRLGYYHDAIKDQFRAINCNEIFAGLAYYNVACNYSLMNNRFLMLDFLEKCRKKNYFKSTFTYHHFIKDSDFDNFKSDSELVRFTKKISRKVKQE